MCRLFGMHAGGRRLKATFWLLEAPDSLSDQSRRNPDGYGLGTFAADGTPVVAKQPAAAYEDESFAREAREEESTTFTAHVRYASTGGKSVVNTHPFEQEGRLFAHNGHVGGLERLEAQLGAYRALVKGDTDSERVFALVTKEAAENGGDVGAAIHTAVSWIARELPLFALNVVLSTPTDMWALRYPDTHELRVLERERGGCGGERHLDAASPAGTVRVRSAALVAQAAVVVASEQMDEDAGWRMLEPGELIHVSSELEVSSSEIGEAPAHCLTLEDLEPGAAASQSKPAASGSRG